MTIDERIANHPSFFFTPLQQRFNWRHFRFEFGRYYGWMNEDGYEEKQWVWASEETHQEFALASSNISQQ